MKKEKLKITDTAYEFIMRNLKHSREARPVVVLFRESEHYPVPRELADAALNGASQQQLRQLDARFFADSSISSKLVMRVAKNSSKISSLLKISVKGIEFGFDPLTIARMDGWVLNFNDNELTLEDKNGTTINFLK